MPRLGNEETLPQIFDDINFDHRASSPYLMDSPIDSPAISSSTYRFSSLINSPTSPIYSSVRALAPSSVTESHNVLKDDEEDLMQPKETEKLSSVSAKPRSSSRLRLATLQETKPKSSAQKLSSSTKRKLRPQQKVEEKGAVRKRGRPATTATTLRKKKTDKGDEATQEAHNGRKEWEVEQIVDSRIDPETMQHWFKVKWKGYTSKHNTWEPKKNLTNCKALLEKYEKAGK
ncbi:uncharacterized protein TrAFT101_005354 [Trichoderma asperellum]|uniref:uncharacterized protein n=1 Tax=Trichoderma asperellum TaxID=101201 RepID=UPI00332559E8|nr:hypothetical protein TrAFT101_005354 [Trichoderma asperellum]